jgi:hypothetical protein
LASSQVEAVRDEPAARLELIDRTYHGPIGRAPRHLPFRRAALSFMRWQLSRGVLAPLNATPPGSPWWRAVNERLLRDWCGCQDDCARQRDGLGQGDGVARDDLVGCGLQQDGEAAPVRGQARVGGGEEPEVSSAPTRASPAMASHQSPSSS